MQTFALGEVAISAVVRDAQDSPVPDYAFPIDLRLCDAPTEADGEPRCPAAHASLIGTVQVRRPTAAAAHHAYAMAPYHPSYAMAPYHLSSTRLTVRAGHADGGLRSLQQLLSH